MPERVPGQVLSSAALAARFRLAIALTGLGAACWLDGCSAPIELGEICGERGRRCACVDAEQDLSYLPEGCESEPETCGNSDVSPDTDVCNACLDANDANQLGDTPLLRCACQHCAVQLAACRDSSDAERNQLCQSVVNCAVRESCAGSECYCGAGVSVDECRRIDRPAGPCARLITDLFHGAAQCAAGEPQGACILRFQEQGGDNALHRAFMLSRCMGNPVYGPGGHCLSAAPPFDAGAQSMATR
jgi:hypothetical protein